MMIAFVKEIGERLSKGDISKHLNQGFVLNCFILSYLVSYNFISICLQRTRLSLIFCIHDFFKIFLFSYYQFDCVLPISDEPWRSEQTNESIRLSVQSSREQSYFLATT